MRLPLPLLAANPYSRQIQKRCSLHIKDIVLGWEESSPEREKGKTRKKERKTNRETI
jgi:hypothetical protein